MRLEAQAKAGYYPTPPRVTDQIAAYLTYADDERTHALDPCAGTGEALAQLVRKTEVETHGIELSADRAIEAVQQLDHAWHADAGDMDIAPDSFSLLFLNPPYDYEDETGRLERQFVQRHTAHLMTDGVLVLIVTRRQAAELSTYLYQHYDRTIMRLFPQPERAEFDQVAIFGVKRPKPTATTPFTEYRNLLLMAEPPTLAEDIETYHVPRTPRVPAVQRNTTDWNEVATHIDAMDAMDDLRVQSAIAPRREYQARPLTTMQDGHIAQLAAAGLLDNMEIRTDDAPLLVKGRSLKVNRISQDDEEQKVISEQMQIEITTLDLNTGEVETLDRDSYAALLTQAKATLIEQVAESYPPQYVDHGETLPVLHRRPIGRQAEAIRATAYSLNTQRATTIMGEMGVGKTYIAAAAAHAAGKRTVLVLCPPHLTRKWKREIEQTIPGSSAAIVSTITAIEQFAQQTQTGTRYAIMSSTAASLGHRRRAGAARQYESVKKARRAAERVSPLRCPDCHTGVTNHLEELQTEEAYLTRARRRCKKCGTALWSAEAKPIKDAPAHHNAAILDRAQPSTGTRKYPLADYIAKRHRHLFDLLILDEVHEYKAGGSARGIAAGKLSDAVSSTLALTGTYAGGYASTLFYLLYRFSPHIRDHYGHDDVKRWISHYGFTDTITKSKEVIEEVGGRTYRTTRETTRVKERPGIMPQALHHVLSHSVFIRLSDVAEDLPAYAEIPHTIEMTGKQKKAYDELAEDLKAAVMAALANGSQRLLGVYVQALLSYPDAVTAGETVIDKEDGTIIASAPALSSARTYPKEDQLVKLIHRERARNRKVLVFVTHTESRDITPRVSEILRKEGINSAVLKSKAVKPDQREKWIAAEVEQGIDALIVHPRTVQTGLDLIDFPTIVWYEPDYSIYTVRQASRRSWRIGQTEPVEVHHMVYADTMQEAALSLVAGKLNAAKAIDGDIDASPLDAAADTSDSMLMELARSLTAKARYEMPAGYFADEQEIEIAAAPMPEPEQPSAPTPPRQEIVLSMDAAKTAQTNTQLVLFEFAEAVS